jgi:two-component system chemotaxis response regulator CheB
VGSETHDVSSTANFPVIALVGSAGGLEAVSQVLSALADDLEAEVIVLIHQPPDRPSSLVELLATHSALPVAVAEHDAALQPARVIVAPPGRHLLVTPRRTTALIESGAAPPSRPSADLLLTTLATAVGPQAIAVVLSGGGHDGATGATAVHLFGGTVLASDEASSTSYAMPLATIQRDSAINQVAPLSEIADLLVALIRTPRL